MRSMIYFRYKDSGIGRVLLSLIKYYGGKYNQTPLYLPHIISLAKEMQCYGFVECTAGGARTLLNLPKNLFRCKVYNEFDVGLCRLFACVKEKSFAEELVKFLRKTPYDKEYFEWAKTQRNNPNFDIVTSAALTYICAMQSRDGDMEHFRWSEDEALNERFIKLYYNSIAKIIKITPALQDTVIMSADFRDVLQKFQKDEHIIKFIDPPYHPITRSNKALDIYPCELTIADHKEMVDILAKSRSWILCGYDPALYGCDDYKPLEKAGAVKISIGFFHLGSSNQSGLDSKREEFIWIKK